MSSSFIAGSGTKPQVIASASSPEQNAKAVAVAQTTRPIATYLSANMPASGGSHASVTPGSEDSIRPDSKHEQNSTSGMDFNPTEASVPSSGPIQNISINSDSGEIGIVPPTASRQPSVHQSIDPATVHQAVPLQQVPPPNVLSANLVSSTSLQTSLPSSDALQRAGSRATGVVESNESIDRARGGIHIVQIQASGTSLHVNDPRLQRQPVSDRQMKRQALFSAIGLFDDD